jgi:hypothetical protein
MPFTERPSQPVVNFVALGDVNKMHSSFYRYRDWSLSIAPKPHVKYAKQVLGKQDAVKTYLNRYWVWETETWRLFASVRGMTLEVILPIGFNWEDRTANRQMAADAINNFVDTWEAKKGLLYGVAA